MHKLFIKNMVCNRCILVIEQQLQNQQLPYNCVSMGVIEIQNLWTKNQLQEFTKTIYTLGFEIIDEKKAQIVEQIKNRIIQSIHYSQKQFKTNLSNQLQQELGIDYKYVSQWFFESEQITIEKYYIAQRIEKVKELLSYNELTLHEIAQQLNYSSSAYLSNQFKKLTGFSPSQYKKLGKFHRKFIDHIK